MATTGLEVRVHDARERAEVTLVARTPNEVVCRCGSPLDHDGLDAAVAADVANQKDWNGEGITRLREHLCGALTWESADVEPFLARLIVRAGYLLGNPAGQWESGWTKPTNVLAGVAVSSPMRSAFPSSSDT